MKFSNSQMISFQKCEKRYYYEHVLKLRAKGDAFPEPLERGINGHLMIEAFFRAKMNGADYEGCVEATNEVLLTIMGRPGMDVYRHVLAFGFYAFEEGWEPILIEENIILPVAPEIEFAFTPDVVFKITKGVARGKTVVVDYKFVAQYWRDQELDVFQQLPKYINGLNEKYGWNIRHAAIVMLSTRAAKTARQPEIFMVKYLNITKHKLARIQLENKTMLARMKRVRDTYDVDDYMRTSDVYACKMCPFSQDLCAPELNGHDISKTIERNFEVNTYFEENYGAEPVDA